MTTYYLIRGSQIVTTLDASEINRITLPRLAGDDAMSLLNAEHAQNLMSNLGLTAQEALGALGVVDLRESVVQAVCITSQAAVHGLDVTGLSPYHLADIDPTYSLWQVDGQQADLLRLHQRLWAIEPQQTLGLIAAVQTPGESFYADAIRIATGMTIEQALARRDRIAAYLESLDHTSTATLRAATTEGALVSGIAEALGYTAAQVWSAMVATL
jgi:hypothetical protein